MKKRVLSLLMACLMVVSTFIVSKPIVDVYAVESEDADGDLPDNYKGEIEVSVIFDETFATTHTDVHGMIQPVGYTTETNSIYTDNLQYVVTDDGTWYVLDSRIGENTVATRTWSGSIGGSITNIGGHYIKNATLRPHLGSALIFTAPTDGTFEISAELYSGWFVTNNGYSKYSIVKKDGTVLVSATNEGKANKTAVTVTATATLSKGETVTIIREPMATGSTKSNQSCEGGATLAISQIDHACSADTLRYVAASDDGTAEHYACYCGATYSNAEAEADFVLGELSGSSSILAKDAIVINNVGGNNHVVSETKAKNFTLQADVTFNEGTTAGFIFGCTSSTMAPTVPGWLGVHVSKTTSGYQLRIFREGYLSQLDKKYPLSKEDVAKINSSNSFHLKVSVEGGGVIKAYINGASTPLAEITYTSYPAGYIGMNTYRCESTYTNMRYEENKEFFTNLTGITAISGTWMERAGGYGGDNSATTTDVLALFNELAPADEAWVFETDMHLANQKANGGLVFGVADRSNAKNLWYGANIDRYWGNKRPCLHRGGKLGTWAVGTACTDAQLQATDFHLRLIYDGEGMFEYYVDGVLSTSKYYPEYAGGYLGLSALGANVTFNNVYFYNLGDKDAYYLTGLEIEGGSLNQTFVPDDEARFVQATADVGVTKVTVTPYVADGTKLYVNGTETASGTPVEVTLKVNGYGYVSLPIETRSPEGYLGRSFQLMILKPAKDEQTLYTYGLRPQFHYTAPYGWVNDPNGMLYNAATGEYHFFYQANPYSVQSSAKHWGHATTSGLVKFEEKLTAVYPDNNGDMWSGSGIIDYNNEAGLYEDDPTSPNYTSPEARMVLFYYAYSANGTSAGLAYTEDGGETWVKERDENGRLRLLNFIGGQPGHIDPKVFWVEDLETWIMVTASGKYYTSDNLHDWTYNSSDKGWECPDFFEMKVEGTDETKWVRVFGGSFYRVGDFVKQEDGTISFVSETDNLLYNGDSHRLNDSVAIDGWIAGSSGVLYATQHFKDAPNDRIITVSWLRENYGKLDPTGTWTGAMTVPTEQKLYKLADGSYLMTSYPVEELKALREDLIYSCADVEISPTSSSTNILDDESVTLADIDGTFTLGEGVTEFGFKLRTGTDGGYIAIKYDVENEMLTSDFTNSQHGTYNGKRTMKMNLSEDRCVTLRILLDNIIVEAYGNDGEAAISSLFYRPEECTGIEFYTVGGNVTVDELKIYSMGSSWSGDAEEIAVETNDVNNAIDNILNGGTADITVVGPTTTMNEAFVVEKIENTIGYQYALFNIDFDENGDLFLRHHFIVTGELPEVTVDSVAETLKQDEGYNTYYVDTYYEAGKYDEAKTITVNGDTYEVSLYSYIKLALEGTDVDLTDAEETLLRALYDLNEAYR